MWLIKLLSLGQTSLMRQAASNVAVQYEFKQAAHQSVSENNRGGSQNCRAAFSATIGHKRD
jgi:hypothetical protein